MELSETKEWIKANLDRLMGEFGVPHWRIEVEYHDEPGDIGLGNVTWHPERESATIRIVYPKVKDKDELAEIVEHELCHVVHSPIGIFWSAASELMPAKSIKAMDTLYLDCLEMVVRNMERMRHCHKTSLTNSVKDEPKEPI